MKADNKVIGIVCPVFNEEENINTFIDAFDNIMSQLPKAISIEYLFVDNASTDDTEEILNEIAKKRSDVNYVRYSRNFGVMKSIYTGLLISPTHWSALAVYDCDLQDPPELVLSFLESWLDGCEIVYGKRIKRDEGFLQTLFRKIFKFAERRFHNTSRQIESGAWFASSKVIREIKSQRYFQQYLPAVIDDLGFKKRAVEYSRKKRVFGKTKFNFFSYTSYALDGLIMGSFLPLRIPLFVGILFSLLSVILGIYFIVLKLLSETDFPEGTVAVIVISLFANALNFMFLGIIGEYVGRILNNENYKRPAIIDYSITNDGLDDI